MTDRESSSTPQETTDRLARIREKIANIPKAPGVYLMKDSQGRVLYIGKAKDLRSRVSSYFQPSANLHASRGPEIAHMADQITDVDFLECETEVDAMLQENRLIKDTQPPYNERLRDDKSFPYLMITSRDDYPGIFVTREPQQSGAKLYGPFVSAGGLRDAVTALQKVFKFRTCTLDIQDGDPKLQYFRPCLLYAIDQCTAPCAAKISQEDYRKDIDRLKSFLASKRSVVMRQMKKEMTQAAEDLRFEDAAGLRDRIRSLESLSLSGDPRSDLQPEVFYIDPKKGLASLAKVLEMDDPPRSIEGVDIAHLQGAETVGALVCFIDGLPFKAGYRRYRIREVEGIDDYAAIREVVERRYRHAGDSEELFPDVILIDGGLGQLHAAMSAFQRMDVRPPMVISLAKREEEIFVQARSAPIKLGRNNPALRLLQSIRDESHRFGQHYHHILRAKKTFDEDVNQGRRPSKKRKRNSDDS
jgi:excinuclease ABC subunit C